MSLSREFRLAVHGTGDADLAGLAPRLRGATVEACDDLVPPRDCDAVLIVGDWAMSLPRSLIAGVPVLLVAEPCPGAAAIADLHAIARGAGCPFAAVNPDRYLPSRQLIRKQLSGPLGEPGLIRIHRWERSDTVLAQQWLLDIDTTLWLAGQLPDTVYSVGGPVGHRQVHLGFPHGSMALLDYDNGLPPGDGYRSLSVIARSGAAYADDHQNAQLVYGGGHARAVRTGERVGQLAAIAQDFIGGIRDGRDLAAESAAAWSDVSAVADAVRESLASRRPVTPGCC